MANTVQSDLRWEGETGELIEGYDGSDGVIGFIHRVMTSEPSTHLKPLRGIEPCFWILFSDEQQCTSRA
jgi:hypothetical protein